MAVLALAFALRFARSIKPDTKRLWASSLCVGEQTRDQSPKSIPLGREAVFCFPLILSPPKSLSIMATEASSTNQKPPVPPQGAPCWIEICSTDPEKLKGSSLRLLSSDVLMSRQDFYAALFPAWKFVEKANETAGAPVVHFTFEQPSGER